jgi:hypothetical protein
MIIDNSHYVTKANTVNIVNKLVTVFAGDLTGHLDKYASGLATRTFSLSLIRPL